MKIGIIQGGKFKELIPIIKPSPPVAEKHRLIVSGAGTAEVNGEYEIIDENATGNARQWKHISQNMYIYTGGYNYWKINTEIETSQSPDKCYYFGNSAGGEPYARPWQKGQSGTSPNPIVTEKGA